MDRLKQLTVGKEGDIIMMLEHNKNLSATMYNDKPSELIKKWWPATITRSVYLVSANKSRFEPGGTMIITHSKSTAHTCSHSKDTQHLGRWNYITLKGKKDKYTTIISVYRPSTHQETYLRQAAYTAKRRKILQLEESPDTLWYADLKSLITDKLEMGHEVIVAGDFNDDLNNKNSMTNQLMYQLGMREVMIESAGKGPATYVQGSTKIDGIFATFGIQPLFTAYTSFKQSPSDHRWLIIDIPEGNLVGTPRDDKRPPLMRKCTSKIPSVRNYFQSLVESQVIRHNLHKRIEKLYQKASQESNFTLDDKKEYELIETRMQRAVRYGDRKCRKARMGTIAFSPAQKRLMGAIIILKQIKLRFLLKGKSNRPKSKRILRLFSKYDYKGKTTFSILDEINHALRQSIVEYNEFKKCAKDERWSHLEQLARELDQLSGKGVQHHFRILQNNEKTKDYFRRIRQCEGKARGGAVEKIMIEEEGEQQIVFDKSTIEKEIMKVNEERLLQASNTPLRSEQLSILLGEQGDFDKWEEVLRGCITLPQDVDEGLQIWYDYITSTKQHGSNRLLWTTQEYCESWSKISENKSTLPGIEVAHIKSLNYTSTAADVLSKLALIPLIVGYSPEKILGMNLGLGTN